MSNIEQIRDLLLAVGEFEDNHTADAARLAKIAELVGLQVVYEPCDGYGCGNKLVPMSINVVPGDPS